MNSSQTHLEQATHRHRHCHHQHHRHRHHHHHFFHPVSRSFPHHHHHHHHHHYHHRHVRPQCAFLNQISPHPTLGFCPNLINPPLQNTQHAASASPQHELPHSSHETQTLQEDSLEELEDEDDEEPVFVMTDEWREFFASSEARRTEAKKLAKQQGKK